MPFMQPDRFFSRVSRIDVEKDLVSRGLTHVLLDVDNTILRRDNSQVPRDVREWLSKLDRAGVKVCLVSNNWHDTVVRTALDLGLPIVTHSVKPLPPAFLAGRGKIGGRRKDTVVIGDQLITDGIGAHFLGMPVYMVRPLVEQDLKHTLMLRRVERLFMGGLSPEDVSPSEGEPVPEGACAFSEARERI